MYMGMGICMGMCTVHEYGYVYGYVYSTWVWCMYGVWNGKGTWHGQGVVILFNLAHASRVLVSLIVYTLHTSV